MKDQVLSIEQMQKLKELGVNISKSSMTWFRENKYDDYDLGIYSESISGLYELVPTFTLQDMIELMPNNVKYEDKIYYLSFDKKFVGYIDDIDVEDCVLESYENILENTYKVLVWLTENKYI